MTIKAKNIIGWTLSGLVGLALSASAIDKIVSSEHSLQMAASFGLSAGTYSILGVIEIISVALFVYPRTGVLGTLLLSSYLGGAIATHLQHQQGVIFPMMFEALIWVAAIFRSPEITKRILNNMT